MAEARSLRKYPVHLGLGARASAQPEFTGMPWYEGYVRRTEKDGNEGRLVAMHDFSDSWDSWEMHPEGEEVVVCISGEITLIQELETGEHAGVALCAGEYAINPAGVWHTADVDGAASALFITAGAGTQHRLR